MNQFKFIKFNVLVLLPITIGGCIYIFCRKDSLLMFKWLDFIGILNFTKKIRESIELSNIPSWFIYSLPDALWLFSFTSIMLFLWGKSICLNSTFWILLPSFIGLFAEIGQALNFVPGTYDIIDLIFLIIVLPVAIKINHSLQNISNKYNEKKHF